MERSKEIPPVKALTTRKRDRFVVDKEHAFQESLEGAKIWKKGKVVDAH